MTSTEAIGEPPAGLSARATTMQDVPAITELVNICSTHEWGEPDANEQQIKGSYEMPGFDIEHDTLLVETEPGQPLAVVEFYDFGDQHNDAYVYIAVHHRCPERQAVAGYLMAWADQRGVTLLEQAQPGLRVFLDVNVSARDPELATVVSSRGYKSVRHSWHMEIQFDSPVLEAQWPEGITCRTALAGVDERAIYEANMDAFSDHWGFAPQTYDRWLHSQTKIEDYDPSLWFLAVDGDEIAGFSLCVPERGDVKGLGWVNDLAVRRPWRERGIGLSLLQQSYFELQRRGCTRVGLSVDSESLTGATRLYERAGMRQTRQHERFEKELRPGKDLRTLELTVNG